MEEEEAADDAANADDPQSVQKGGRHYDSDDEDEDEERCRGDCDLLSITSEDDDEEREHELRAKTRKNPRSHRNKTQKRQRGGADLTKNTAITAQRYDTSAEEKDEFWKLRWYSYDYSPSLNPASPNTIGEKFYGLLTQVNPLKPLERTVKNSMLGWFSAMQNPEDNVFLPNLLFADVFTQETFSIDGSISNWTSGYNFQSSFKSNYDKVLNDRKGYLVATEYGYLNRISARRMINAKEVVFAKYEKDVDFTKFLNFHCDASFIQNAIKEYSSTYNPLIGRMLHDYNQNKAKFLEDYAAGKYKDPKAAQEQKK
jgi:hypothetical protein